MKKNENRIRRAQAERGATVVEFAVVLPLLLFILFGILEYGIIFMQIHLVENAAREGVRRGVVADTYNCWDGVTQDPAAVCNPALSDRKLVVDKRVRDYLSAFYDDSDMEVEVTKNNASGPTILTVKVTVPNFMPKLISGLFGSNLNPTEITYTANGEYENPDEP